MHYSIIATVYNDENEIAPLLRDIYLQTCKPNEIIISEGGSSDNTKEIIEQWKNKLPIRLLENGRMNISQGLNYAIGHAKNEYIGIVATGNRYESAFFEKMTQLASKRQADVVYAPIRGCEKGRFSKLFIDAFLGKDGNRIPSNHGIFAKKDVFTNEGGFYEKFVYAGEDAEFYQLISKRKKYKLVLEPNAYMYWCVPRTIFEYKKQRKAYTIANLQMKGYATVWNNTRNLIRELLAFVTKNKDQIEKMKVYSRILDLFYSIINLEYAQKKWRVKR